MITGLPCTMLGWFNHLVWTNVHILVLSSRNDDRYKSGRTREKDRMSKTYLCVKHIDLRKAARAANDYLGKYVTGSPPSWPDCLELSVREIDYGWKRLETDYNEKYLMKKYVIRGEKSISNQWTKHEQATTMRGELFWDLHSDHVT